MSFIAGYTYAHGLDNGSLNRFGLLPQNSNNPGAEYGNSDFDVRHRLTFTGNLQHSRHQGLCASAGRLADQRHRDPSEPTAVARERLPGHIQLQSVRGDVMPRTVGISSGTLPTSRARQNSIPYCTLAWRGREHCRQLPVYRMARPARTIAVSNSAAYGVRACAIAKAPDLQHSGCRWLFRIRQLGHDSSRGRNLRHHGPEIFRDSGFKKLDLSIFKNFTWKERYTAQFRLEVFNILNHPIPENPYGASNGSSGGNNDPSIAGFDSSAARSEPRTSWPETRSSVREMLATSKSA